MSIRRVAALYVDPKGPYPRQIGVTSWDETRNANTYQGTDPVVAHPPCGPWGPMRGLCTKQDPECAPQAVRIVRRCGGVLEHPRYSRIWPAMKLPLPGELPDSWGGRTFEVNQLAWGHACSKPTWLYVVGVSPEIVVAGIRTGGMATHRITSGPRSSTLPSASALRRRVTPPLFAEWLIELARASRVE